MYVPSGVNDVTELKNAHELERIAEGLICNTHELETPIVMSLPLFKG
jgi:hypothetical protein